MIINQDRVILYGNNQEMVNKIKLHLFIENSGVIPNTKREYGKRNKLKSGIGELIAVSAILINIAQFATTIYKILQDLKKDSREEGLKIEIYNHSVVFKNESQKEIKEQIENLHNEYQLL